MDHLPERYYDPPAGPDSDDCAACGVTESLKHIQTVNGRNLCRVCAREALDALDPESVKRARDGLLDAAEAYHDACEAWFRTKPGTPESRAGGDEAVRLREAVYQAARDMVAAEQRDGR